MVKKRWKQMNDIERAQMFVRARPMAGKRTIMQNGNFFTVYTPRLAGHYVCNIESNFDTPADAIHEAKYYQKQCQKLLDAQPTPASEKE